MSRVLALATGLTAIAFTSGTLAGSKAEMVAESTAKWTVSGTAGGDVRIKTSDGIVLEARQIRFRLPPSAGGDVPPWNSITGQSDKNVIMTKGTSGARSAGEGSALRTKAFVIRFQTNSFECDIIPEVR